MNKQDLEIQQLVLDYLTKNAVNLELPLQLPTLLKQITRCNPLTHKILDKNKLETAIKKICFIWGPDTLSFIEEGTSQRCVTVTNLNPRKIALANAVETCLKDGSKYEIPSALELPRKRKISEIPLESTNDAELDALLNEPTFKESQDNAALIQIHELIDSKTSGERLVNDAWRSESTKFREYCQSGTKADCCKARNASKACNKIHFRPQLRPHTDRDLGDCSYLNTCHRMDSCKYVHYEIDDPEEPWIIKEKKKYIPAVVINPPGKILPSQWINCDVRKLDFKILGKFSVIMADPPWDIHMSLPYGTMTDDEMREMGINELQDEGLIFLWVTGRAMELGRECLACWGYDRVDELVWIKTNQLQRIIRTGRTGHWLNHSKEHCLVGSKGKPQHLNLGLDCDVLVGEVRETSRKPDEIYGIIDRLSPGGRKLEIFGRQHNTQPGWLTLGNQLENSRVFEPDLVERYNKRYPNEQINLTVLPEEF